jgi:hypothetical protein
VDAVEVLLGGRVGGGESMTGRGWGPKGDGGHEEGGRLKVQVSIVNDDHQANS